MKLKKHMWTIQELDLIRKVWDKKSVEDISKEIDVMPQQVQYIANQMRKEGIKLSKKHKVGHTRSLIREYAESIKHR